MPERRTSSVASFVSTLHFSGKVIMASVLFGFGLLLVGTILLIIATGGQKSPPLKENAEEEKKSPMTYVGPGVMGVGAFFVIVGTIMCLFETRILRRRKNTDHESLVRSEIPPMANPSSGTTENQEDIADVEETQVKTVLAQTHPVKNLEKPARDTGVEEKDYDRQLSSSIDREQAQAFGSSVYVDAVGENEIDENDNEEHFTSGSAQFSTPPEANTSKISLDSQSGEGHDLTQIPDPIPTSALVTEESEKGNELLLQKDIQTVSERDESSLLMQGDNEITLPVSNDSIPTSVITHTHVNETDLAKTRNRADHPKNLNETDLAKTMNGSDHSANVKESDHRMNVPETEEDLKENSNTANEE